MHVLAADWGTGQVFWSMLWFFMFFIWIWLLIIVFSDIFRSHDLGRRAKALWIIFVILVPYLGVFVYLIARGHKMQRARGGGGASAGRRDARSTSRACRTAQPGRRARQAGRPARRKGVIDDAEYAAPEGQGAR